MSWERRGQNSEQFRKQLAFALLRSGICLTLQNEEGEYLLIANLPDCWSLPDVEPTDASLFGEALAGRLSDVKTRVVDSGGSERVHADLPDGRYFELAVEAPELGDGFCILTTIVELTEERRRERVLKNLLREVSHRSKNLLAIIQSIASQTARSSTSLGSFLPKFHGRLHSLSQSQDLITDSSWRGARFRDLARQQCAKYFGELEDRVVIAGDNPMLSPNQAMHVGLALHELIVNAVAASRPYGGVPDVSIRCDVKGEDHGASASIAWSERRDAGVAPGAGGDQDDHFGGVVLKRVAPSALNGHASYVVDEEKISYSLTFPLTTED
ncbi:sensor histidine kinase [Nitratireductor mangrovi]|uniref:histidine kinase n=1 Tax=Nitratireductor mangrovi TaxID=2599600 RepID=A0A5B8L2N6_9HYPH|nr:sensor histidine kinase [Nitratireductor mangrovi]QDZ02247.1 sensor histidine kinase [Nitratireductor mangrovi]